ncbi:MAG TPA: sigma-54 dependent transcriptional regulator, partial [Terriglobales bacterium]|nr:sigma-54 dependent transcriptional regulator [Terriglobales bacterium]
MRRYLRTCLELQPYRVETADSGADALSKLGNGLAPNLVLLDVGMPGLDGLEALQQIRTTVPNQKVVMLSCLNDTKKVVRAMQLGASDYLTKPVKEDELAAVLRRCIDVSDAPTGNLELSGEIVELSEEMFFVCSSPAMQKVRSQAALVAGCDIPILLLGESGTGKEVMATLIHQMSHRASGPFVKVNCAAVPSELLESELFGYEPGAFTGAVKAKPGRFELCNKGTILLDEIGEMSPALQAKLLHVLQDQEFSRLGGRSTTKVDVRILAATNINIQEAIASKKLRSDLYYRLNGLSLRIPPLRERKEEIPLLLRQFVSRMSARFARPAPPITDRLIRACIGYSWPGNLRELQNFAKRFVILRDEDVAIAELSNGDLPGFAPGEAKGALKSIAKFAKSEAEAVAIAEALQKTNWKRKEAAKLLGISYKALLYKMRDFGL